MYWYKCTELVNTLLEKLDKETRTAFELSLTSKESPYLNNITEFLESRSLILDQLNKITFTKSFRGNLILTNKRSLILVNSTESVNNSFLQHCVLCQGE